MYLFPVCLRGIIQSFPNNLKLIFSEKDFFFFKVSVYERILKCSHSGSRKLNTFRWLVTVINFNLSPSISHRKYSYEWMLQQVHPNAKPLTGHVQLHQNSINDIADSTCLSQYVKCLSSCQHNYFLREQIGVKKKTGKMWLVLNG